MAKPGEFDFVPLVAPLNTVVDTLSVGIFQWVYKADGHGLKKSAAVYRVKGPAYRWELINSRAKYLCGIWNNAREPLSLDTKSETI